MHRDRLPSSWSWRQRLLRTHGLDAELEKVSKHVRGDPQLGGVDRVYDDALDAQAFRVPEERRKCLPVVEKLSCVISVAASVGKHVTLGASGVTEPAHARNVVPPRQGRDTRVELPVAATVCQHRLVLCCQVHRILTHQIFALPVHHWLDSSLQHVERPANHAEHAVQFARTHVGLSANDNQILLILRADQRVEADDHETVVV